MHIHYVDNITLILVNGKYSVNYETPRLHGLKFQVNVYNKGNRDPMTIGNWNYKIFAFETRGQSSACLYYSTIPRRFYYVQRQTFPAMRIVYGIKMTAHWILRTCPTSALHTNSSSNSNGTQAAMQTARCAGDFHRRNNAFIGIPMPARSVR